MGEVPPLTPLTSELYEFDTMLILQSERELRGRVLRGHIGLLSINDLCDMLSVTPPVVSRWHKAGTGPKRIAMGNHAFYRCEDVRTWLGTRVEVAA
jgi:predicted DNA-binding transcriptional regulator AlpA